MRPKMKFRSAMKKPLFAFFFHCERSETKFRFGGVQCETTTCVADFKLLSKKLQKHRKSCSSMNISYRRCFFYPKVFFSPTKNV